MNEFIVWDKDNKVWVDESYPFFINSNGLLCIKRNDGVMQLESNCEVFKPIGIKDINNKKIYANSSIVEFEIGSPKNVKFKGYFSFDNERKIYAIRFFENNFDIIWLPYWNSDFKNINIVDTIQQNKLGLIK